MLFLFGRLNLFCINLKDQVQMTIILIISCLFFVMCSLKELYFLLNRSAINFVLWNVAISWVEKQSVFWQLTKTRNFASLLISLRLHRKKEMFFFISLTVQLFDIKVFNFHSYCFMYFVQVQF